MDGEGVERVDAEAAAAAAPATATLVVGSCSHDAACRRLADADREARRIRVETTAATTAAAATAAYGSVYDDLPLDDAGVALADAVGNLEHGDATDGALVVCVDGLPAPSSRDDRERLFRFLHAVTRRVQDAGGHCHVHLSVAADAAAASVVAPLFEYVVDAESESP